MQMETKLTGGETPLLTFQIITDTHVTADPAHEYNRNFERALQDLAVHARGSSGIMHIGDITDHGFPEEYTEVQRILGQYRTALPEIRYTLGNHDVGIGHWQPQLAEAGLGDWESRLGMYTSRMGSPGPYHDHWIGGYHFIFLGTEEGLPIFCSLSEEQLQWLERKLGERPYGGPAAAEQPVFLFLHQPLMNTVAGSLEAQEWYGVTQDKELRAILDKFPQTLLFTGHTHWELESEHTMFPGNGETAAMFNAASVAYLWNNEDVHLDGSQGYYIEVYSDKVLVRGRDFTTGTWIESACFEVPVLLKTHK